METIAQDAKRDRLDATSELRERVFEQTAEALAELILQVTGKKIAPSTLRSSSALWKSWTKYRNSRGNPSRYAVGSGAVDLRVTHVGGARRTADELRCDALTKQWELSQGISLDDVPPV
jgi:hypothetical protein